MSLSPIGSVGPLGSKSALIIQVQDTDHSRIWWDSTRVNLPANCTPELAQSFLAQLRKDASGDHFRVIRRTVTESIIGE